MLYREIIDSEIDKGIKYFEKYNLVPTGVGRSKGDNTITIYFEEKSK